MDKIGDSAAVVLECKKEVNKVKYSLDKLLDEFQIMLMEEEDRLHHLNNQRIKIEKEIEVLADQIAQEKIYYRESMDILLNEREKQTTKFIEDFQNGFPNEENVEIINKVNSFSNLIEACKNEIESISTLSFDIKIDTEKIRCEVMNDQANMRTKEYYLKSMREYLEANRNKC